METVAQLEVARRTADAGVREAAYDYDLTGDLGRIEVPTLVLHPDENRLIPAALARKVASGIPGAEFVLLRGTDPFPWYELRDEFVARTCRFITGATTLASTGATHTMMFTDLVAPPPLRRSAWATPPPKICSAPTMRSCGRRSPTTGEQK